MARLWISSQGSRQLVTRPRKRLLDGPRVAVASAELRRMTVALIDATQKGNLPSLEAVLSPDVAGQ